MEDLKRQVVTLQVMIDKLAPDSAAASNQGERMLLFPERQSRALVFVCVPVCVFIFCVALRTLLGPCFAGLCVCLFVSFPFLFRFISIVGL